MLRSCATIPHGMYAFIPSLVESDGEIEDFGHGLLDPHHVGVQQTAGVDGAEIAVMDPQELLQVIGFLHRALEVQAGAVQNLEGMERASESFRLTRSIYVNKAPNTSAPSSIYSWTWIRSSHLFATCSNVPRRLHKSSVDHKTTITNVTSDPH